MNLAHYLSSGIIAPANYIQNRNNDLQNRFENNILLSHSKFTDETNCAVEIVFNENEEKPKKISDNFFLFDMPLPISRVKSIYFSNEDQKISTLFNVKSGAAFIPDNLIKVANETPIKVAEIDRVSNQTTVVDWSHYLKRYDQILGGFALMRIGKEEYQNYSTHFFKTLGNINSLFDKILQEQGINLDNTFAFAFTDNGKFKTFHDTIFHDITSDSLSSYAKREQIKLETKNGLVQLNKIPENTQTYIIAILETYGPGKRKQVDSFISDLVSAKFNANRKEGLALSFGINKGYSVFRNKYKTENFEINIKFKLNSKLDYYIIESAYQSIFNDQKDLKKFSFIDRWCPTASDQKTDFSGFKTYRVLDKTIILNKKGDFFLELFHSSLEKRNKQLELVLETISKSLSPFLSFDSKHFKQYIQSQFDDLAKDYAKYIFEAAKRNATEESEINKKSLETTIRECQKLIQDKDTEIKILKRELEAIKDKEESVETKPRVTERNIELEKTNINEAIASYEKTFPGSLFSEENSDFQKKEREKKLKSSKLPELKKIASNKGINISNMLKADLIDAILKKEF